MTNSFTTERLSLEFIRPEDYEFVLELVNTKGWLQFIGDRYVHTNEEAVAYINRILTTENLFYWVVRTRADNTPVGIVSFLKRAYLDHFDIGFAFLPKYSGLGYAYEAAREVLSVVSKSFHPVLATTLPANEKSIHLLKKLGLQFQKEIQVEELRLHVYSNAQ